ncbi:anti-sigma factor [Pimelobacter simplex]|uniref:anti-sigma factor n=1 Tax=Nocardioides simplex TaxID=2045 RepID=UPI00214FCC78|nr:anti-sigma factor [Pimelobacter simplex]UUW87360.1 anti-sigma factor [Pimelobacter simplex]UUW96865.1 anti-sigma factor [Pimelobacter simplex]
MSETSTLAAGGVTDEPDEVALRLPADGAYASVLRTLTAGLAARVDFTMDDIEDLRIAVSEAAAMVLDEADAGAVLDCRFELGAGRLALSIAADAAAPSSPDYESFGWQVLATLADEAAIDAAPGRYAVRLVVRSSLPA